MLITENNRKYYVAIKSLSRLLSSQNTKHKEKEYSCMNCLQGFNEESSRDEHLDYCINNESVKVEMPHRNLIVQYSDGQFQFKVPFIHVCRLQINTRTNSRSRKQPDNLFNERYQQSHSIWMVRLQRVCLWKS